MPSDPTDPRFDWDTATTLEAFLAAIVPLTAEERGLIIAQAKILLGEYYVHLPFKLQTHVIDPLGDLDRLSAALPDPADDVGFHRKMCAIFAGLRDLHTQYSLPGTYQKSAAILPFKLGACVQNGKPCYLVTEMLEGWTVPTADRGFGVGAEIVAWDGVAMDEAVARLATLSGGASSATRRARALASMTLSPMDRQPPPAPARITLAFRGVGERAEFELALDWRVIDVGLERTDPALAHIVALDQEGELRRRASAHVYHPKVIDAERHAAAGGRHKPYLDTPTLPTTLPSVFKAQPIEGTEYGYIRIFTFNPPGPANPFTALLQQFIGEFVHLIGELPQQGLVVDVRGNGGGYMPLAEALLQTMTDTPISPQLLELRATPSVLALARASGDLHGFVPSLEQAIRSGSGYSKGQPLTNPAWCNGLGRQYPGPVVLIMDARCYSSTDAFVAGFQDHGIGKVIGVAPTTGAGGANMWTLPDLMTAQPDTPLQSLPQGASLRAALRRSRRVARNSGMLVEEFGVTADIQHSVTRSDLLYEDRDLLALAVRTLHS